MSRAGRKQKAVEPAKAVKNYIQAVLNEGAMRKFCGLSETERSVPFKETWIWEERPTFSDPHLTRIEFHGRTHISTGGWARYEGPYGTWIVDLLATGRDPRPACIKVYGTPSCVSPSDEWRETTEERRERLTELCKQYSMTESPNERWSWYKVS